MPAIFALAGVIIGGILAGAVQMVVQRRAERRDVRVSCRLLLYELILAVGLTQGAMATDTHPAEALKQQLNDADLNEVWTQHRTTLAAELNDEDWHVLRTAIVTIELYIGATEAAPIYEPGAKGDWGPMTWKTPPGEDEQTRKIVLDGFEAMKVLKKHGARREPRLLPLRRRQKGGRSIAARDS